MKTFVQAQGFDVWKEVIDGYKAPSTPPTNKYGKKLSENNLKAKNATLIGLASSIYFKVMHCDYAMNIWDKLQIFYEGDAKFNGAKLQTYRGQFEKLKMKEDEYIVDYFL
jgi:hypothetical protein